MTPAPQIRIDPKAIQVEAVKKSTGVDKAKGISSFNAYMSSANALGPFAGELTYQTSGNVNAATVLSAAFSSFPAAASAFAGYGAPPSYAAGYSMGMGMGGTITDQQVPGLGGSPGIMRAAYTPGAIGTSGSTPVTPDNPNFTQAELLQTMNQNNLALLELQAVMQSNMQQWNTKSNVLSADHRAKMSLIEKFTARG